MKLLTGDHSECKKQYSDKSKKAHVCVFTDENGVTFWKLLRCMKNYKGGFNTTEPLSYFAWTIQALESVRSRDEKRKRDERDSALVSAGASETIGCEGKIGSYMQKGSPVSKMGRALDKTARFYIYGKGRVSKSTFDDE